MNRKDLALQRFSQGYNCAQSVFTVFATENGLELDTARRIAALFGGGIARSGEVCGAINGGLMALGLTLAMSDPTDSEAKDHLNQLGQEIIQRFEARFGARHCRTLTGLDLRDPQDHHAAKQSGVLQNQCPEYVAFVVQSLEDILESKGNE
ncbi:MAG: hypothetical protein DDG59_01285 [Anaerolineae bacterium]|jgi:C_GCAxxG_C_C family probable redox protein|nr:MAG: hypothetical protein DDG59_01285 [Anaerolineae bacterium]